MSTCEQGADELPVSRRDANFDAPLAWDKSHGYRPSSLTRREDVLQRVPRGGDNGVGGTETLVRRRGMTGQGKRRDEMKMGAGVGREKWTGMDWMDSIDWDDWNRRGDVVDKGLAVGDNRYDGA